MWQIAAVIRSGSMVLSVDLSMCLDGWEGKPPSAHLSGSRLHIQGFRAGRVEKKGAFVILYTGNRDRDGQQSLAKV